MFTVTDSVANGGLACFIAIKTGQNPILDDAGDGELGDGDEARPGEVLAVMKQLAQEHTTMICVTHEMGFAREVGTHVVFMDGGLVVEEGPPAAVLGAPQMERTKNFLSKVL